MCQPASFVVTKKEVFWSENSDSHELIIEEKKLKEMDVRGNPTFVRIEIVPPNNDYRLPFKQWNYKLDQDIRPEWYDGEDVERRCRAKLKDWRKANVVMPREIVTSLNKYKAAVYGTIKSVCGGTIKYVCGRLPKNGIKGDVTLIAYNSLTPDILKSSKAVLIDRSGDTVKCYIGKDEE